MSSEQWLSKPNRQLRCRHSEAQAKSRWLVAWFGQPQWPVAQLSAENPSLLFRIGNVLSALALAYLSSGLDMS
jgi:hypothetical protein